MVQGTAYKAQHAGTSLSKILVMVYMGHAVIRVYRYTAFIVKQSGIPSTAITTKVVLEQSTLHVT